jgi:Cys-tRNA(Pro) deacylase
MGKDKTPVTPAVRMLREQQIPFTCHPYAYEERGGTAVSARELQVDEYCVIKTLVMEDEEKRTFLVLMHGNRHVSTRELARLIGARSIHPSSPETAQKQTGYLIGGTSPFGTRHRLPVYVEASVLELPKIYINGGKRGFLVGLAPEVLCRLLGATQVRVAI